VSVHRNTEKGTDFSDSVYQGVEKGIEGGLDTPAENAGCSTGFFKTLL
jgi:hypothetical protein